MNKVQKPNNFKCNIWSLDSFRGGRINCSWNTFYVLLIVGLQFYCVSLCLVSHNVLSTECHLLCVHQTCSDIYDMVATVLIGNFMTGWIRVELKNNSFCCLFSFGWFPGVWFIYADVSEHCICSIFKGRCEVILGCEGRLIYTGGILGPRKLGPIGNRSGRFT